MSKMKAVTHYQYGSADVLRLEEIEKPIPKANEVLIKVHASTVNRTDTGFRSAEYVVSRLFSGLLKPKNKVLGSEFAGEIEDIGKDVTLFKIGEKVFGYNDQTFGGNAQYMVIAEDQAITSMPAYKSYEESACIAEGAHYALCDLRAAKIQKGQRYLINGTTGAIGKAFRLSRNCCMRY
jgi:NADPH:quinone reductase-like Zn-dependent oxidoreductase